MSNQVPFVALLIGTAIMAIGVVLLTSAYIGIKKRPVAWKWHKPLFYLGSALGIGGYLFGVAAMLAREGVARVLGVIMVAVFLTTLVGLARYLRPAAESADPVPLATYILQNASGHDQLAAIVARNASGARKIRDIHSMLYAAGATRIGIWPEAERCFVECTFPNKNAFFWVQAALRSGWGVELVKETK